MGITFKNENLLFNRSPCCDPSSTSLEARDKFKYPSNIQRRHECGPHKLYVYDGCNTCIVSEGTIRGCTKMMCFTMNDPYSKHTFQLMSRKSPLGVLLGSIAAILVLWGKMARPVPS